MNFPRIPFWTLLILGLLAPTTFAEMPESVDIALIGDGPSEQWDEIDAIFRQEIQDLLAGEVEVRFHPFQGDWNRDAIFAAADAAYSDPEVDLLLVTGFAGNQIVATRRAFPKPTFLPLVLDARLLALPRDGGGSGLENLNYLSDDLELSTDIRDFATVTSFERVALLVDGIILDAVGPIAEAISVVALEEGVEMVPVPYLDPEGDLVALIPEDVDAVMVGGLPRLDQEEGVQRLVDGLIDRGLPSYSLVGDSLVNRGLMVAGTTESDWTRLARRNALNMQAVILGEPAEAQPVDFDQKRQVFINMATARAIDRSPRFDVLIEAVLIEEDAESEGPLLDLGQAAREAVDANLDLLAQRLGTEAGIQDIVAARAALRPSVDAQVSLEQLDGASSLVVSGAAAQRSTSAALSVSQLVWSEEARAGVDLQQLAQVAREAELEAFRLDTIQLATVAYLDTLRAETQVRVQRDNLALTRSNLELAQDRVDAGSATAADVYRWQSQLATARRSAIDAYTQRVQARENLKRVLHRPLDSPLQLEPTAIETSELMVAEVEMGQLVGSPRAFETAIRLLVSLGLQRAPELASLQAAMAAKEREIAAAKRAYTHPTVSLQGRLSTVLEEDRSTGPSLEGDDDWSVGLVASLPLWRGGERRARVVRAELELDQLRTQYSALRERIEQRIRSDMNLTNASFLGIGLAEQAAEAAGKNLELISDAYSQGAVSILELLDAQSAALQANEAAANATYGFLIDLLNLQRSSSRFDFFLSDAERRDTLDLLREHIASEDRDDA
ncbi:MAG: TolC family protein [Acidobacteriota bacterium]